MRTHKIFGIAAAALLALGLIGTSAVAAPPSGTWTFTDTTPNPSNFGECMNTTVPPAPTDVNSHPFKAKRPGSLSLTAHNSADWAAEVRDKNGNIIASADGTDPTTPENMVVTLRKGSYVVSYCNFAGEHEITVDYKFTFSKVRGG